MVFRASNFAICILILVLSFARPRRFFGPFRLACYYSAQGLWERHYAISLKLFPAVLIKQAFQIDLKAVSLDTGLHCWKYV